YTVISSRRKWEVGCGFVSGSRFSRAGATCQPVQMRSTRVRAMRPLSPLRWRDVYREAELYKAAVRVYTKPLFHWRKALSPSTDGRNLSDMASGGLRGLDALHRALASQSFGFRPALARHHTFNGKHRTLYLAPWEDRIVDLLLYRVINRRLHGWFSPHAYAY